MKKAIKRVMCIALCLMIIPTLSSCSKAELTEENITSTVETVEKALQSFDKKKLEKYVDSETLSYILKLAKGHEQFDELGVAIFENLEIDIQNVDVSAKTVDVVVKNKDLYQVASNFTYELLNQYSSLQLLQKLNDDDFLDDSLSTLTSGIQQSEMSDEGVSVTLTVTQGKRNLIIGFDDDAEDAVSGGALTAIKELI